MNNSTFDKYFHYLSFLQYPFLAYGVYLSMKPNLMEVENKFTEFNSAMTFLGIAITFGSLVDIKKKNWLGKQLYTNKGFMKGWMIYLCILFIAFMGAGVYAHMMDDDKPLNEMSSGIIILGLSVLSLMKMSMDNYAEYNAEKVTG